MDINKKAELNLLTTFTFLVSPFLAIPLVFYSMFKRMNSVPFLYAFLVSYISYLYVPPYEWDKTRHMEFYELSKILSIKEFFILNFEGQPDFLFRLLLFVGAHLEIRVHYIFFFITFITVYLIFKVYFNEVARLKNIHKYAIIIIPLFVFSISYTDIISGLRYTLAVSFIFYGYYVGLIKKKKIAIIWLVLGAITHFSVLIFVILFFCIPIVKRVNYKWLKVGLTISLCFILIPENTLLSFFKGIGLGGSFDTKIDSYLDKNIVFADADNFAYKVINFFNIAWVVILNFVLLLKKNAKVSILSKIITLVLITTNVFASFPVVYNRYNLFLKLILVLFLLREELNNSKLKISIIFVLFLFVVYFNQLVVMRLVLMDIFFKIEKWSLIYQFFYNDFTLNDIK